MSQHDMTLDNGPGVVFRGDANNALKALASQSSGAAAPGVTFPCQLWADTGTGRLRQRNAANSIWLDRGPLDATLRDAASDGSYAADTGTTNAFSCSFVPSITARNESTPLRFKVANANSGASTINDGFGTVQLVGKNHAALQGGETVANGIALIQWNGSIGGSGAYVLVFCTGAAGQVVNQQLTAFTTAGTAPSFTLTPSPAIQAYATPQRFRVKFHAAGSDTINVSGRGPKALKQYDSTGAKVAAVIAAGQLADVEYDGTDMVLLGPIPLPAPEATPVIKGIARHATSAETRTGTDATTTVTPAGLESAVPAKARCTAWVNFNGIGTVAIRDSFNVSSITDNGVADYTANFAANYPNTNFAAVGSSCPNAININNGLIFIEVSRTVGSLRVQCVAYDASKVADVFGCNIHVMGGN